MLWLCIFRAISGIGGGGIVNSVWLITSEIVEEQHRAKWSQALSVTWSASAVAGLCANINFYKCSAINKSAGPLLGGVFSGNCCAICVPVCAIFNQFDLGANNQRISWRWACALKFSSHILTVLNRCSFHESSHRVLCICCFNYISTTREFQVCY